MAKPKERAVVVCTDKKGVFFGYADKTDGDTITLKRARMCVYWTANMKGVMGLASKGPDGGCRIGDAVPAIELRGITCVVECSSEAIKRWEDAPWQ